MENNLKELEEYVISLEAREDFKQLKPFGITTLIFIKIDELNKSSQSEPNKNNTQQQPQECGNTSKSCVEEKNNQIKAHSDSGVIPSGSVEDYLPCSSPVVETRKGCGKNDCGRLKGYYPNGDNWYCDDCEDGTFVKDSANHEETNK